MDAGDYILLAYAAIFVPMLVVRPRWPFRFTRSLKSSPEAVWRVLNDFENATFTYPHIEKFDVQRDPNDPTILHCIAYLKRRKRPFQYVARLLEAKPCEVLAYEFLDPKQKRQWGRSEYRLGPDGSCTLLEIRARMRVQGILGVVFVWRAYRQHLKRLEALAEWS